MPLAERPQNSGLAKGWLELPGMAIWHEITGITSVDETPTVPTSAKCFIEMFQEASRNDWNQDSVVERLGMI